jgi:hypothetical protein
MAISWASVRAFKNQFRAHKTTEAFVGLLDSGHVDKTVMERCAQKIFMNDSKTIEFMCHPGIENDGDTKNYSHWKYEWQKEYNSLINMKDFFCSNDNINMISFNDLNKK